MDIEQLQQKLRSVLGLRVGNQMAKYILAKLANSSKASFPIFASDARTGHPLRREFHPAVLDDPQLSLF